MSMMRNPWALGLALWCVSGGVAAAASAPLTDASFVKQAALDGMMEVEMANLANEKSSSTEVKTFAARMLQDHTKANADLAALAQAKHIKIPGKLDIKHRARVDALQVRPSRTFDLAYAKDMVAAHGKAVSLFTRESRSPDADFAGFARKTLPTLQEHERMAQGLAAKIGRSAPTPTG